MSRGEGRPKGDASDDDSEAVDPDDGSKSLSESDAFFFLALLSFCFSVCAFFFFASLVACLLRALSWRQHPESAVRYLTRSEGDFAAA